MWLIQNDWVREMFGDWYKTMRTGMQKFIVINIPARNIKMYNYFYSTKSIAKRFFNEKTTAFGLIAACVRCIFCRFAIRYKTINKL